MKKKYSLLEQISVIWGVVLMTIGGVLTLSIVLVGMKNIPINPIITILTFLTGYLLVKVSTDDKRYTYVKKSIKK